jgi:hypothetical protein
MPNGKVFYGGTGQGWNPFGQDVNSGPWAFQQFFDPQTKKWEVAGVAPLGARGTAGEVMLTLEPPYDQATILSSGQAPPFGIPKTGSTVSATASTSWSME